MKIQTKSSVHDHLLDEADYCNLTAGKIYEVIEISDECYRVVCDDGEPYLYPKELFTVVDAHIPESWMTTKYADDEYYIYPSELSNEIFSYEKYFGGISSAVKQFEAFREKYGLPPRQELFAGKPRKPLKPG